MNTSFIPNLVISACQTPQAVPSEHGQGVGRWRGRNGDLQALGHTVKGEPWFHVLELASYHLSASETTVTAYPQEGADLDYVETIYYRTVLPLALQLRGQPTLHASSVCSPKGVIGFCAQSRTGKSTLAYSLQQRGFSPWGDDVLAFSSSKVGVTTLPLPFRLRLRPSAARYYELPVPGGALKWESPLNLRKNEFAQPLAALILVTRLDKGVGVKLKRLKASKAYSLLVNQSSYIFDLGEGRLKRDLLRAHLDLVAHVPVYKMSYPTGLDTLAEVLDTVERLSESLPTNGA